ncbi:MAG: acetylxylan esterase [Verrucomicrobiota bacterium]|nr:acetylxylan esterase [Verrucomicrobiota bacterium]MCC6823233.1 acetylxylan esterase [Limisphaerales bacterium]
MKQKFCLATGALLIAGVTGILSQPAGANYDEANVPVYTLPDPLVCPDGTVVTNAVGWQEKRRPELVRLFEEQVYGRAPERPRAMRFETISVVTNALGGRATRKEVAIWFTGKKDGPSMNLLLYLPNAARQPVPAFLGLSFNGNHAITSEPDVRLSDRWLVERKGGCVTNNRATDACRGSETSRWPVEKILARGYALATAYYGDLEPDFAEGWKQGVRAALSPTGANPTFPPDAWGAIGAWAWGLSRALDYLETERPVNANHVAVLGHSRLGKTALWAGARDERFAIVISNDSGEGGAALARRRFGERTADLNRAFPHWFSGNFKKYSGREDDLPVDQHELLALIAPRPVYVASATEDLWADPRGEFLAAKAAEPVYQLFGQPGLGVNPQPAADQPVGDAIGYHLRSGKHELTDYDWAQYLNFADRHFHR